jgi:hypothetical protein
LEFPEPYFDADSPAISLRRRLVSVFPSGRGRDFGFYDAGRLRRLFGRHGKGQFMEERLLSISEQGHLGMGSVSRPRKF